MQPIRWGPFALDPARRQLTRGDRVLELQPRALDVLLVLAQRLDQAVSRADLLATGWPGVTVVDDALSQVIRKIRSALGDDAAEPAWLLTVPRYGYRLVSGTLSPPPQLPSVSTHTTGTALYGRSDELGWCRAVVAGGARVITIAATGGYGKTALASAWLSEVGGVLVSCAQVHTASELALAVASLCEIPPDSPVSAEIISTALARRQTPAILFDDADHLDEEGLALAGALSVCAPDLVRIHTSRKPLGLSGEVTLSLPGLALEHAAALLADRIGDGWADKAALRELAASVDGSPLALELLAGRAAWMSLPELRERLVRPLELLSRAGGGHHDSLRSCLSISWDLLSASEQRTFAALALFDGGFSIDEAEQLTKAQLDVLESLIIGRLIRQRGGMLSLGHPERQFARERLALQPDVGATRARFRVVVLAGGRSEELLALARDRTHPRDAARALAILFERWQGGIGLLVLERLAGEIEAGPETLDDETRAVLDLVRASFLTGRDLEAARARWQSLLRAPDPDLVARGYLGLAGLAAAEHEPDEASRYAENALSVAVRPMTRSRGAILAAHVANRAGQPMKALKLLLANEPLDVTPRGSERSSPERKTRAVWLAALASTRRHLGDSAGAESALSAALSLAEPNSRIAAGLQVNLGGLLANRGALREALVAFEGARVAFVQESDLRGESECLYGLALVHLADGDLAGAEGALHALRPIERSLGSTSGRRRAAVLRAAAALARGSPLEAMAHAELALDPDDPQSDTDGRALLAVASARLGSPREVTGEGIWAVTARAVLSDQPLPEASSAEAMAALRTLST